MHADRQYAAQAAQATFDLVDRLERELSRFLPNSDITRINHLAAGESTRVAPSTLECLLIARHMFDLTDGAFDVRSARGSVARARPRRVGRPCHDTRRAGRSRRDRQGLRRRSDGGAARGVGPAGPLVHGGFSSVLALEPPAGHDGWPLTLSDPSAPSRVLARLSVRQTALGASGVRKGDHIVDPRTGQPARGRLAAWVAVPTAAARRSDAVSEQQPRARRRRGDRCVDDRVHAAARDRDRGAVPEQPGRRGLDPRRDTAASLRDFGCCTSASPAELDRPASRQTTAAPSVPGDDACLALSA